MVKKNPNSPGWYHLIVHHGPGRQSTHREYRWYDPAWYGTVADWEAELKERYDDWEAGPAIVNLMPVTTLPDEDYQHLLRQAKDDIARAERHLARVKQLEGACSGNH